MINILLSILSSTSIFILFKGIDKTKAFTFHVIIINYFVAFILGMILSGGINRLPHVASINWFYLAVLIGMLFMVGFLFIGISSQRAGISITTVASKMSVIIPVIFSILYYKEIITWQKITGISLAILALMLTIWRRNEKKEGFIIFLLPLILFFTLGTTDSMVKFAQQSFLKPEDASFFTSFVFGVSFLTGVFAGLFRKDFMKGFKSFSTFAFGILLGCVNFGSIYFLIRALNETGLDSSAVFGINNIGIVALSVVMGLILFKEKLKIINWIGIMFSLLAIWFLTGMYGIG
jgi:drug/metabolite transporter (DMT)-like permease